MSAVRRLVSRAGPTLLTAVLVLTGCSDDPEPKFSAEPSESASTPGSSAASPTREASAAAPSLPPKARRNDADGAAAFARFYLRVLSAAQETGDTSLLRKASTAACEACQAFVEKIDETYTSGGHISGGELEVERLRELPLDYGADWGGYAIGSSSPQVIVGADGERERFPGGNFQLYAYAKWHQGGWKMHWLRTTAA